MNTHASTFVVRGRGWRVLALGARNDKKSFVEDCYIHYISRYTSTTV